MPPILPQTLPVYGRLFWQSHSPYICEMSSTLTPYLIKIKLFQSLFGSKSSSLFNSLVSDTRVSGLIKKYDAEIGGTPFLNIITDFFDGEIRNPEEPSKYWYVLKLVCIKYVTN